MTLTLTLNPNPNVGVTLRVPGLPGASAAPPVPPPALLRLVSRAFESLAAEPRHAGAWDAVHCTLPHVLRCTARLPALYCIPHCTPYCGASTAMRRVQCTVWRTVCGAT